jgi:hypothetical protein
VIGEIMSKDALGCGLVHAGVFNGVALWEMYWKNKIVFYVKVDTTDPELVIKVQSLPRLDEPAVILPTNGRAMMVLDTKPTGDGEADVEVIERVSSTSVQAYIYPRVQSMVMRLYVPGYAEVKAA